MKYLISGTSSGLGKYLFKKLNSQKFVRKIPIIDYFDSYYDCIIHCAFNNKTNINQFNSYNVIQDNILLTNNLLQIPHRKFIYLSSINVYEGKKKCTENSKLSLSPQISLYAASKIISESIVKRNSNQYLILRPSAILGSYMRKNTTYKVIKYSKRKKNVKLKLSKNSTYNFIHYHDIYRLIKNEELNNENEIFNVTSNSVITLYELAKIFDTNVTFGKIEYNTPFIPNTKLVSKYNSFDKNSIENVKKFYKEISK